jgi:hypothetical protein
MKLPILFVTGHVAVFVPNERDHLAGDGGELIHTRGPQPVFAFILDRKKPVAVYDFKRMARGVGVGADVV